MAVVPASSLSGVSPIQGTDEVIVTRDGTTLLRATVNTLFTSPELTGTPTAPTASLGTATTQIATTQFVADSLTGGIINSDDVVDATGISGSPPTVSGALTVLNAGKQPLDATLTSIAGLDPGADQSVYFTATNVASTYTLTAQGRALVDDATAADQRTTLGLGTIATQNSNNVTITGGSITGISSQFTVTTSGSAATPEYSIAGDLDTGFRRSSANSVSLTTGGGDAFRIDASQRTLMASGTGFSTNGVISVSFGGNSARLQVFDFAGSTNCLHMLQYAAAATGATMAIGKSRSTTVGTFATVNNADNIFQWRVYADDGAAFQECARITADVNGTPAAGSVPGRWRIQTGTSTATISDALAVTPAQRTLLGTLTDNGTDRLQVNGSANLTGAAYKIDTNEVIDSSRHHRLRSYTLATLPSATTVGQVIFVSDYGSGALMTSDGTTWKAAQGGLFVNTATATVTNTTTETTILGTGSGSKSLPANFRRAGQRINIIADGIFDSPVSTTLTLRIKLGGVTLATASITDLSTTGDQEIRITIDIVTRTTGVSGTVVCDGVARYRAAAGGVGFADITNLGATSTVDSTASNTIDVTAQWDAATATRALDVYISYINVEN